MTRNPRPRSVRGQRRAITTGPFDSERLDLAEGLCPADQVVIAVLGCRYLEVAEPAAELVQANRDMNVEVGVDPDGHQRGLQLRDGGHCHPVTWWGGMEVPAGPLDSTATGQRRQAPIRSLIARSGLPRRWTRPGPTDLTQGTKPAETRVRPRPRPTSRKPAHHHQRSGGPPRRSSQRKHCPPRKAAECRFASGSCSRGDMAQLTRVDLRCVAEQGVPRSLRVVMQRQATTHPEAPASGQRSRPTFRREGR